VKPAALAAVPRLDLLRHSIALAIEDGVLVMEGEVARRGREEARARARRLGGHAELDADPVRVSTSRKAHTKRWRLARRAIRSAGL